MAFIGDLFPLAFTGPDWSEQLPNIWTFQDDDDLNSFLLEVRNVMMRNMDMYHYNSVPSFTDFYQKYKASGLASLSQFYHDIYEVEISSNSLSCVTLSVIFMLSLKERLSSGRYSKTCDSLYYASCSEFPTDKVPVTLEDGQPMCPPELTDHLTVALMFVLHKRKGHVIMDFGYGLDLPVVVMEDGDAPHTESFDKLTYIGTRSHYFRYATSNFIQWTIRQPNRTIHLVIYLKHAFQRLDLPEKRRNVNSLQAIIVQKGGGPFAGYFGSPGQSPGTLTVFAKSFGVIKTAKIPYNEVFIDGQITNEVLNTCLECLGPTGMQDLKSFLVSCQDATFAEQLLAMDKNFRQILADIWNNPRETMAKHHSPNVGEQGVLLTWGPRMEVLDFPSEHDFQNAFQVIHEVILKTFRLHAYNTLDSFIEFHNAFRSQTSLSLEEFNAVHPVKFDDRSLSCVGLSLKVKKYLNEVDATLGKHLFVACGEEYPIHIPEPKGVSSPSAQEAKVKGHGLLALEFCLGGRKGYFVIDVGIALDIPIVVMRDGLPPHTGLFKKLARIGHREYQMDMTDPDSAYVLWSIRESSKDGRDVHRKRFLYVGMPYGNPEDLERRNRVYMYHAYMLMGSGGILAAMYFVLGKDKQRFTVFVPDEDGEMTSASLPYDFFCSSENPRSLVDCEETSERVLETFSRMCGFGDRVNLFTRMRSLSETCSDTDFLDQVTQINGQYLSSLHAEIS